MKVKFTGALESITQAVAIKSQSGCLLRKQIAMIIPTCHPQTALKHPSIRQRCNTIRPKQSSPSTSLSRTITLTEPLRVSLALCTPFTHHDVSTVCRRGSKDGELFDPDQDGNGVQDTLPALFVGWINQKTPKGLFLNFGHTAGWVAFDADGQKEDFQKNK